MVAGHGLDIVDITDFSRLLHEPASKFLDRHFTEAERRDAGEGVNQSQKLAGRFAVKEAVMKALDVGWGDGISSIVVVKSKLNNRRILAQSGAFLLFGLEADVKPFRQLAS